MYVIAEHFVLAHLPPPPARVLEVGCGEGELARALDVAGYAVTAIDPEAPEGPMFVRATLEEFETEESFAAVVANRSLHHIADLEAAVGKIHSALQGGGRIVLNEFGHDRMDPATARWYLRNDERDEPVEDFLAGWAEEHEDHHPSSAIRSAVDRLFEIELFEWCPYAGPYRFKEEPLIDEETRLIAEAKISALGYRLVGRK